MASKWEEIRKQKIGRDGVREARIRKRRTVMKIETALYELRRKRGMSQDELADVLDMGQRNVSRIEHGEDPRLSTLAEYIAGLGGRVEVHAVFPEEDVVLASFAHLDRKSRGHRGRAAAN